MHNPNKKCIFYWIFVLIFLICYPIYEPLGIFAGAGLILTVIVILNLGVALPQHVSIPHLMILNYVLQHFLAALVLYIYPPDPNYDIGQNRYPIYLSYAVPCCIALYGGVSFALRKIRPVLYDINQVTNELPAWAYYWKYLYFIGLLFHFAISYLPYSSALGFFILLLSFLRYVGLFTGILLRQKTWLFYAAFSVFIDLAQAASRGMFHDLILSGGSLFLIIAYRYRWRARGVVVIVFVTAFLIIFQSIKEDYRQIVWHNKNISAHENRFSILGDLIYEKTVSLATGTNMESLGYTFVRFNQGWIVDRVMRRVPDIEPYAHGATIVKGMYAAFIPRFIDPDKPMASGRDIFLKYTGISLRQTAMSIGVSGEMYANFGFLGGIIGVGVFGFLVGFLYMRLYKRAAENPVWWAWGPFVGFWAMKAEEGIMEITTWVVKSLIVMATVIFITNLIAKKK